MTDKITLVTVGSVATQPDTAVTQINENFSTLQTASNNTLSRDGTSPNQMLSVLDMNSNQIINLPAPITGNSPLRLTDAATLNGGGTINVESLPVGGTTGQVLAKNSGTDYDAGWETIGQVPTGGSTGQVLEKNSGTNFDTSWGTVNQLTSGGTTGQVLTKNSGTNYDASWQTFSAGSGVTGIQQLVAVGSDETSTWTVTNITNSTNAVITIPGHTMLVGDSFHLETVAGMTSLSYIDYTCGTVTGNNILLLSNIGSPVDTTSAGTFVSAQAWPQITRGAFTWPVGVTEAWVQVWGSGGAGGGSSYIQWGGAGGGGGFGAGIIQRPVSGVTDYVIDHGMRGIPADTTSSANLYSGITAFGTYTLQTGNPYSIPPTSQTVPTYTGDLWAGMAGVGEPASANGVGGDGGTGGIAGGTYLLVYRPGGQGGASPPAVDTGSGYFNATMPAGSVGASGGGQGGNNGQDGVSPGGGGAPGSSNNDVTNGFLCSSYNCPAYSVGSGPSREVGQSGQGGAGEILVMW